MFPFREYLFLSWHLTHRGGGRIFAVFWTSDAEKITIFWESSLWEKIAFFRPGQSFCSEQFPKKSFLGGIFWNIFFIIFLLRGHVILLCFLGCPRLPEDCVKKRNFFVPKKWRFFGWERTVLFGSSARLRVLFLDYMWRPSTKILRQFACRDHK